MIHMQSDDFALTIFFTALYGMAFVRACQRYRASKSVKEIFILVAVVFVLSVIAVAPQKMYKAFLFALLIMWTGEALQWWRNRQANLRQRRL